MLFAKIVLLIAILIAVALGVFMRVRAWRRRKRDERDRWNDELARDIRNL